MTDGQRAAAGGGVGKIKREKDAIVTKRGRIGLVNVE